MANQQELRDAAIWIAAMILGEGSIVLSPTQNWSRGKGKSLRKTPVRLVQCCVNIYNSDMDIANEIQRYCKILGAGEYRYDYQRKGVGWGVKPLATIKIRGFQRLARFLPQVIPFLVGDKLTKAILTLQLCEQRKDVPANTPYTQDQITLIETLCPGRRHNGSSETNAPDTPIQGVMIESDPNRKLLGGETVREYPSVEGTL